MPDKIATEVIKNRIPEIVFITDLDLSNQEVAGIWLYIHSLSKRLTGFKRIILGKGSSLKPIISGDEHIMITPHMSNIKFIKELYKKSSGLVINEKAILHAQRADFMYFFRSRPNPKFITFHGNPKKILKTKSLFRYFIYRFMEQRVLPKTDRVIFIDRETKQEYELTYPQLKNKFVYIPSGVDTELFISNSAEREHFLYVGRLAPEKRIDKIIEAYKKYTGKEKLLIIGTGPLFTQLKTLAENDSRIIFTGFVDHNDLPKYYQKAKGLFLFSSSEGLPLTVLEALSCGVPVIATPVGDLKYLIKKGYNGMLVDSELSLDFEYSIHRYRAEDCINSTKEYAWENIAKRIIQQYKEVLKD
ncbi:MAG: glycosyltransferase family 4 protein [Bacteroidales bacterium]|nr:glycosyltransferase family 4 protein [Bacteroidales bacterium]